LHSVPKSECSARPLRQSGGTAVLPGKSAGFEPNAVIISEIFAALTHGVVIGHNARHHVGDDLRPFTL
jgi:hypothetical protein